MPITSSAAAALVGWPSSFSSQPKFIAPVTARESSSACTRAAMVSAVRLPFSVACSGSSLNTDQRITEGWLRSRRTMVSSWASPSAELLNQRVSSITSIPRASQASSSSGAGGLWALR